ncbi:MAG: four helix bundle protein [Chitinophagales bacterium]
MAFENLNDLEVYRLSMDLGEMIWNEVISWENLAKYSLGTQVISAADSIANNISEATGRYHYKDRLRFWFFARGSLFETYTQLTKAVNRSLITREKYYICVGILENIKPKMNSIIKSLNSR